MSWLIIVLAAVLVLDCFLLVTLILLQPPKKETGMASFGAGAADALFGPGGGNVLTKMTKYLTIIFLVLTLGISVLFGHQNRKKVEDLRTKLSAEEKQLQPLPGQASKTNAAAAAAATITNAAATAIKVADSNAPKVNATLTTPPAVTPPPTATTPAK